MNKASSRRRFGRKVALGLFLIFLVILPGILAYRYVYMPIQLSGASEVVDTIPTNELDNLRAANTVSDTESQIRYRSILSITAQDQAPGSTSPTTVITPHPVDTTPESFLVSPYNQQTIRVVPGQKAAIGFVVKEYADVEQYLAQVAYRKVGTMDWYTFGKTPYPDPSGKGRLTKPNGYTNAFMDTNGWNCRMDFRTAPPANCNTSGTWFGQTGKPAFKGAAIIFPGITLAPGTYEWTARGRDATLTTPGPWSTSKRFNIVNLPKVMTNVRTTKKMVALTLDDGPSSTAQTCEILKRYNAKATFFYVAYRLADSPSSAPSAQSCGEIGNHTYHHILLNLANYATAMTDLGNANRIFMNIIKKKPLYFRPRSGLYTSSVLSAVLNQGSIIVNWSVGANDNGPENPSRATIVNRILNHPNLKPGAIILLHETYDPTREALPTILSELKNRGYTVTTVSELINNSY